MRLTARGASSSIAESPASGPSFDTGCGRNKNQFAVELRFALGPILTNEKPNYPQNKPYCHVLHLLWRTRSPAVIQVVRDHAEDLQLEVLNHGVAPVW